MTAFRCDPDPLRLFRRWYAEARRRVPEPEVMALATATARGVPSARYVLLKGSDPRGLAFFTHYGSRKARELARNPRAAAVLYWSKLGKQVRMEGRVVRLSRAESAAYFATRPRESRLSACASPQGRVLSRPCDWSGHAALAADIRKLARRWKGAEVPCPAGWGGFLLIPDRVEFWRSGPHRFHYRAAYRRSRGRWINEELAP